MGTQTPHFHLVRTHRLKTLTLPVRAFSRFARSTWARLSSEKVVGVFAVIRFVGRYTDDFEVYPYAPVLDFQFSANHLASPVRFGLGPE